MMTQPAKPSEAAKTTTTKVHASEDERSISSSSVTVPKEVQGKRKWYANVWDTFDKSPEERRFLFKLDAALLSFASLGYFIKYLDQVNIKNAFVSGMKEDLGLYGDQLNYIQTLWTVGYVIGQLPSNIVLTRVRSRWWIPTMEVIWTILTMCISACSNIRQIYALRFLVGLAESTFYPGLQFLIGSWYRRDELAKRSCIFHTSSALGSMFSGYLMSAVYNLDGRGGHKGWQWLFIIDGVISLPIALAGFWFLPDVPEIAKPFYLSEEEVKLAQKRMVLEGREERKPYTLQKIKEILSSWHIYVLSLAYIVFINGSLYSQPTFQQFLKESKNPKYTTSQVNTYPTTTDAVQVVTTLAYAWISDSRLLKGSRWQPIIFAAIVNIISGVSLAVWDIPLGWRLTCYIICGCWSGISGLLFSWAHEIISYSSEERAIVIGAMNQMGYMVNAWLPLIVWKQVEAPQYHKGFITASCLSVALIVITGVIWVLHGYDKRKGVGSSPKDGVETMVETGV